MLKKIDTNLLMLVVFLLGIQTLILFSLKNFIRNGEEIFAHGLFYACLSVVVIVVIGYFFERIRFRESDWFALGLYGISVLLLVIVLLVPAIKGSHRWISLGFFALQPSELARIGLIFLYAKFFSRRFFEAFKVRHIVGSLIYLLPVLILILLEPDFSTALLFILFWFLLLIILEIKPLQLFLFAILFITFSFFAWNFALHDYQKERLNSFLFPARDPLGSGYSVIQSKIAIASGGLMGRGLLEMRQSKYGFLPNSHNDFVLASYIEAFGFLGFILLVLLYGAIIQRVFIYFQLHTHPFNKLILCSYLILFILALFFNIAGSLGLLPVSGNSLPFISYGGSSQISFAIMTGIVVSLSKIWRKSGGAPVEIV